MLRGSAAEQGKALTSDPPFGGDVKRLDGSQLRRMACERRFDIW